MKAAPQPYVREELDARSLHFSMLAIQSRMVLARPDALTLEYTRTMMGWLLLRPQATRLAMLGLGGGSIAKFCHRHLPRCRLDVVEIDPRVIALRDTFRVPPDDARLRVIEDDGAHHVATTTERYDVLMVDAFDADGLPPALATPRFYDDCRDVLQPGGLLVANLHATDALQPLYLDRIRQCFDGRVAHVDDRDGCNRVVIAAKGAPLVPAGGLVSYRRAALADEPWKELRGAFHRWTRALMSETPA